MVSEKCPAFLRKLSFKVSLMTSAHPSTFPHPKPRILYVSIPRLSCDSFHYHETSKIQQKPTTLRQADGCGITTDIQRCACVYVYVCVVYCNCGDTPIWNKYCIGGYASKCHWML